MKLVCIFIEEREKEELNTVIDEISKKYGDNSLLKASSLLDYSTIKVRNTKLGGHNKE